MASLCTPNQCLRNPVGRGFDALAGKIGATKDAARRETGAGRGRFENGLIRENTNYLIDNCSCRCYMGPTFALARGRQAPTAPRGFGKVAGVYDREEARLRGWPWQAARGKPFQEGPIRQPWRPGYENRAAPLGPEIRRAGGRGH